MEKKLVVKNPAEHLVPHQDAAGSTWDTFTFVWGAWAFFLLALLAYVGWYGGNVPLDDEWSMLGQLTGAEPVRLSWLWEPYLEHRVPLTRLILIVESLLSGCNFHVGMFISVLALGIMTAVLIRCSQRLRGKLSYTDAFFPLLLLHFGHWESLLRAWGIAFILPVSLTGILLALAVRHRDGMPFRDAVLFSIGLLTLPWSSGAGLPFLPFFALWFAYCGWRLWKKWRTLPKQAPERAAGRRTLGLILAVVPVALLMVPLYFFGLGNSGRPPPSNLHELISGTLAVGGMAFGSAGRRWWPWSGWAALILGVVVVGWLAWIWWKHPTERQRALGLLLVVAAVGGLALGISRSRVGQGIPFCQMDRYAALAALLLCSGFLLGSLRVAAPWGRFLQMSLFALMCVALPWNWHAGQGSGEINRHLVQAVEHDVRAGMPTSLLRERYGSKIDCWYDPESPDLFVAGLKRLQQKGVGCFKSLKDDPEYQEVPVPLESLAAQTMKWENGMGYGSGENSALVFTLPAAQKVYAIRFKQLRAFGVQPGWEDQISANWRVSWKKSDQADFPATGQTVQVDLVMSADTITLPVWINDQIDQIRIEPDDKPFVFQLSEIVLLVPPAAAAGSPHP